jgi:hypothetical protein
MASRSGRRITWSSFCGSITTRYSPEIPPASDQAVGETIRVIHRRHQIATGDACGGETWVYVMMQLVPRASRGVHDNGFPEEVAVRPRRGQAFAAAPPTLFAGGDATHNIMPGFAVLGLMKIGTGTAATARTLSVSPAVVQPPIVQQGNWDGRGPRCWEYRREAREREWERRRWTQHWRWEEHQRWEESRYPPPPTYGYQYRY